MANLRHVIFLVCCFLLSAQATPWPKVSNLLARNAASEPVEVEARDVTRTVTTTKSATASTVTRTATITQTPATKTVIVTVTSAKSASTVTRTSTISVTGGSKSMLHIAFLV
jgi:hypothetical protein